jgi:hypothetical protein
MSKKSPAKRSRRKRELHEHHIERFLFVIVLILAYLALTIHKHGIEEGIGITALTWAFFVVLTPVPSAGLIFEVPIRFLTNHKLVTGQFLVWGLAAAIVLPTALLSPHIFQSTSLLAVFYHILMNPMPYWSLLFTCALGTFLCAFIVDEMMDEVDDELHHHQRKHTPLFYLMLFAAVLAGLLLAYDSMLRGLNISGSMGLF